MANILSNNRFDSSRRQCFSLPYNCMNYILSNPLSPDSFQKLYKTCKYFYSKKPILVISAPILWYSPDNVEVGLSEYNFQQASYCKFWFNNSFRVYGNPELCIKRIYRCTIIVLNIANTTLNFDEFKILTAEKTIEEFYLNDNITYADGNGDVPIDAILQRLPNIKNFEYWSIQEKFLPKTLKNMLFLKFQNKFNVFILNFDNVVEDSFDPLILIEFLKQNIGPSTHISFNVRRMNAETKTRFREAIKDMRKTLKFVNLTIFFDSII